MSDEKHPFNNEGRERLRVALAIAFVGVYLSLIITGALFDVYENFDILLLQLLGMSIIVFGLVVSFVLLLFVMAVMQEYQGADTTEEMDLIWNHKVQTKKFLKVKEDLYRRGTNLALIAAFAFPITFLLIRIIPNELTLSTFESWLIFGVLIGLIYWVSIFLIRRLYSFYEIQVKK